MTDRAHRPSVSLSAAGAAAHARFADALDDDLDLPVALSAIWAIARSDLQPDERRWLMLDADFVLGLDLHLVWASAAASGAWKPSPEIQARVAERAAARAAGDFARADAIRAELAAQGISLVDRADGTTDVQPAVDSR